MSPDQNKPAHPAPGSEAALSCDGAAASHTNPMDEALVEKVVQEAALAALAGIRFKTVGDQIIARNLALYAARAAIQAVNSAQWRPVAEAPRDGTPFIGGFWSIRWADSHRRGDIVRCWYQPEFDAFISSCREMTLANGCTFEDGATRQLHSPVIEPVTHFMPLPSPPSQEG